MSKYVFDLESNGLLEEATKVHCGVFISVDGQDIHKFEPDQIDKMLVFMQECDTLIGHNTLGFDFPLLEKLYGFTYSGTKIDTMVLSKLFKPNRSTPPPCPIKNRPHSIATWGWRIGRYKPDYTEWEEYDEEMLHRCTEDTEIGRIVYHELMEEQAEYNWEAAAHISNRMFDIAGRQAAYGWKFDKDLAEKGVSLLTHWMDRIDRMNHLPDICICKETKKKGVLNYVKKPFKKNGEYAATVLNWILDISANSYDAIDMEFDRTVGNAFSRVEFRKVDPSKRKEVVAFLLKVGWEPAEYNYNDDGEITSPKLSKTDDFIGVEGLEGKLLAKRIQIRHRKSLIEGLLKRLRADGRLPSVISGLAVTGRAKHSVIVNIPNGEAFFGSWLRRLFICEDDKILIGTDADGCQNRIIGGLVGDEDYTYALLHGTKAEGNTVHLLNQKSLSTYGFEVPYGNCKNLNFAMFFGGGDAKLGKMVGGTKDTGAVVRQALLDVAPGLEELLDSLKRQWRKTAKKRKNKWGGWEFYNGWLEGLDSRPIFIASEHQILVYIVQAAEAVIMTYAYVFLYDWLEAEGFVWGDDWAYVTFYHDELDLECKPEHVERIRFLSEQAITEASKYFDMPVLQAGESSIGRNWQAIH